MPINNFSDGELITAPRLNEMVGQLNTRYYTVDQSAGRVVKVWDYLNNREQLIYGDTGKRYLTHEGISAGNVVVRRSGMWVSFMALALKLTNTGNVSLAGIIPSGFRPDGYTNLDSNPYWGSEVSRRARCTGPDLQFQGIQTADTMNISGAWITSEPWPTSLPGASS